MLAHVYKKKRKKNGKTVLDRNYRGRYRLDGDWQTTDIALETSDKQVAEQRLRDIVKEKQMEQAGLIAPKKQRVAADQPLTQHLEDFLDDLRALGRSVVYQRLIKARNLKLFNECSWNFTKDVNSDQFTAWRAQQKNLSPKTLNEYLNAVHALLNWMVKHERISTNPITNVSKVDIRGRQQKRRAFTDAELHKLVSVAGPRKPLYLTASYTGLRQNELRELCWGDLHLNEEKPFIKARASTTKNGKEAVIPLHPLLINELIEMKPITAGENTRVFNIDSNPDRSFARDLKAAGISKFDGLNRKVDFHALRYTFCTMLAREGTSQRMAQELMRHSDPHLTAQIYTDVSQLPTFNAVSNLPWYDEMPETQPNLIAKPECPRLSKVFNAWDKMPESTKIVIESLVDALHIK